MSYEIVISRIYLHKIKLKLIFGQFFKINDKYSLKQSIDVQLYSVVWLGLNNLVKDPFSIPSVEYCTERPLICHPSHTHMHIYKTPNECDPSII